MIAPVAYIINSDQNKNLFKAVIMLSCKFSILYGMGELSATAFACFAGVLAAACQTNECYEYGALAMKLQTVRPHAPSIARTETNSFVFAQWHREPLQVNNNKFLRLLILF